MKKNILHIVLYALVFIILAGATAVDVSAEAKTKKTRVIHVVYDDSGSMVDSNASWSQAKYALEVFTAMMNENDRLVIYPMSAYSITDDKSKHSGNWHKTISLSGSMPLDQRIKTVRGMNGDNGNYWNTPIQTVQSAGDDLRKATADEKWLLILTDGAFDNGIGDGDPSGTGKLNMNDSKAVEKARNYVKDTILSYSGQDTIRVYFVGIQGAGTDPLALAGLSKISQTDVFYKDAAKKEAILATITKAARTIYNLQPMKTSGKGNVSVSPDIPVSKFVIFAQGDSVKVGELKYQGKSIQSSVNNVEVEVSASKDAHPTNNPKYGNKYADNLKGEILTVMTEGAGGTPFPSGKYSFDCKSDTVEVYFEPGVDIQVLLVNDETGDAYNLSDGVDYIETGNYSLKIQMVNPLTGDVVDAKSSDLLSGVQLSAAVSTDKETTYYADGDKVTVDVGDIEVQGRAVFRNESEKTSDVSVIHVGAGGLIVDMAADECEMDPLHLKNTEIIFKVTDKNGVNLSSDEYRNIKISAGGVQGLEWDSEMTQTEGTFRLIPKYSEEGGAAAVNTSAQNLAVSAAVDDQGHARTGTGTMTVRFAVTESLAIALEMQTPEPKVDGGKYMFDAANASADESAPFILVKAPILDEAGHGRPLNTQEWEDGLKSFNYRSTAVDSNILWKFIGWFCNQTLNFKVVKGEEPSTYKLYLTGLTPVQIRPHTSNLRIGMKIRLENGIIEEGETSGIVTVKPLSICIYIGWLIVVLIVIALLSLLAFLEWKKPRLPRNLILRTMCSASSIKGKPSHAALDDVIYRIKRKNVWFPIFPVNKPEEAEVYIAHPVLLNSKIHLHIVADKNAKVNRSRFRCTNAKTVWPKRNGSDGDLSVTINGTAPADLDNNWVNLSTSSVISIVLTGRTDGQLTSQFTTDKIKKKKKAGKKQKNKH